MSVSLCVCVCVCTAYICCTCMSMSSNIHLMTFSFSKLLQKQLVTAKFNAQVVKEVTAAVTPTQHTPQTNEELDSDDEDEFGAASTYANYLPAKCELSHCVVY